MEGGQMKLSIVIPAYNEAELIGQTLAAATKAIEGRDAEIIVADNNSTDNTVSIVKQYPSVKLVIEQRKGTNQARQAGLDAAVGELVANIDSDNIINKEWVEKVFTAFQKYPGLVGLSGPYLYYDAGFIADIFIKLFYWLAYPFYVVGNKLGHGGAVMGGNVVFKKSALLAAGGYNTSLKFFGDDTDTANRLNKQGKVKFDYSFLIRSSARRFKKDGLIKTGFHYLINHLWVAITGHPYNP